MTPDEILRMDEDMALAFMPGVVAATMKLHVPKYWTRKDLRGTYLGDPFENEPGEVSIAGWLRSSRKARVISEPVPPQLAHLPQYADQPFKYVEGYRPRI